MKSIKETGIKDALTTIANISAVAQSSAESGELDSTTYSSVFEYIADTLYNLANEIGGAEA